MNLMIYFVLISYGISKLVKVRKMQECPPKASLFEYVLFFTMITKQSSCSIIFLFFSFPDSYAGWNSRHPSFFYKQS